MEFKPPFKDANYNSQPNGDVYNYFGEDPIFYKQFDLAGHNGIDIDKPWGTEIYYMCDGINAFTGDDSGYGGTTRQFVNYKDKLWLEIIYGHMSKYSSKAGKVKQGQLVGLEGNTGVIHTNSTDPHAGSHLHLGIREWLEVPAGQTFASIPEKCFSIQNYDNGFKGGVDPLKYLTFIPPKGTDKLTLLKQLLSLYQKLLVALKK